MAEYIDREVAKKMLDEYRISRTMSMYGDMNLLMEWRNGVECAMNKLDDVPTAGVVPKSEVDKTIAEWAWLHADTLNKLDNAKADVARDIFEEIEKIVVKVRVEDTKNFVLSEKQFAELKKKYTGEKECPNCRYFVGCECFDGKTCDEYEEKKE